MTHFWQKNHICFFQKTPHYVYRTSDRAYVVQMLAQKVQWLFEIVKISVKNEICKNEQKVQQLCFFQISGPQIDLYSFYDKYLTLIQFFYYSYVTCKLYLSRV